MTATGFDGFDGAGLPRAVAPVRGLAANLAAAAAAMNESALRFATTFDARSPGVYAAMQQRASMIESTVVGINQAAETLEGAASPDDARPQLDYMDQGTGYVDGEAVAITQTVESAPEPVQSEHSEVGALVDGVRSWCQALSDAVSDYRAQVERNWNALEQNRAEHREEMLGEAAQDLGTLMGTGTGVDTSDPEEYRDSVQRIATDWGPRDDATLREAAAASDSADAPGPAPEPSATEPERAGPEPGEPWQ